MAAHYKPVDRVVLTRVEGGGRVLLRLADSTYFNLNETGAHIWELLTDGRSQDAMADSLTETFEISRESALVEVERFLEALVEAGMAYRVERT